MQFMLSVIGWARILYGYEFPIPHHILQAVFSITHPVLQLVFPISNCDQGLEGNWYILRNIFFTICRLGYFEDLNTVQTKTLKQSGGKSQNIKQILDTIQTIGDIVQTKSLEQSGGKSADHQNTKLSGDIGGGAGEGSQIGFKIDTLSLEFHNYFCCMMMRIENRYLIWCWNIWLKWWKDRRSKNDNFSMQQNSYLDINSSPI